MDRDKSKFLAHLKKFGTTLTEYVSTNGGEWSIKGFIDVDKNIHTISSDTKIISKILEIQLFPKFLEFAENIGYELVPAKHQNWYPDMSFVGKTDSSVKFAVDIKTTYRLPDRVDFCNGFTLGSHGAYFRDRTSTKNIQFPYGDYKAHICLGILYTRAPAGDAGKTGIRGINELTAITSVIRDLLFFAEEKWKIASDRSGSGNTSNIGSINYIPDILSGNGTFAGLGETVFDQYWMNQGVLQVPDPGKPNEFKKLTRVTEFLRFRGMDPSRINRPEPRRKAGQS
ncbi:MAG: EcoRV family type II restriction endonuclease, partial [Hyphomonadaceae bacterium]|nr:EcoRV family type II restriction endonuclease [Hyphomonadaceae bacterium]MBC6412207.1 EcoRV family type II restriction endonuclease [Hyphomonadaceae bacterium]